MLVLTRTRCAESALRAGTLASSRAATISQPVRFMRLLPKK
jgi:hypothetical protein